MIQTLSKLGALYRHEEYQTLSTLWNTYPWILGSDNRLEQEIELEDFYSDKTFKDVFDHSTTVNILNASLENFKIHLTLISIDNLGNLGKDSVLAPNPDPIPREDSRSTFPEDIVVSNLISRNTLIILTQNERNRETIPLNVLVNELDSRELLKIHLLNEQGRETIPVDIIFEMEG